MAKVSVVTYVGEEWITDRMVGTSSLTGAWMGWGTGVGIAAKSDTTLFTESSEPRAFGTVSKVSNGATAKYKIEATFTADADKTITNIGNFTASTGGSPLVHSSFDGIVLLENDQITFTITLDPA